MVSVLFRHISIAKKVSVLFHLYSVRLIPTLFYLIPTQLKTENSVRLKTAIRKKCPLYYCSELKSVRLIPTLLSPPYSNIFLYSKSVYLIPELCPPQYRRQVSVLFLHSVHFIPTWCLPYSYLVFVYLILTSVRLNVGTPQGGYLGPRPKNQKKCCFHHILEGKKIILCPHHLGH